MIICSTGNSLWNYSTGTCARVVIPFMRVSKLCKACGEFSSTPLCAVSKFPRATSRQRGIQCKKVSARKKTNIGGSLRRRLITINGGSGGHRRDYDISRFRIRYHCHDIKSGPFSRYQARKTSKTESHKTRFRWGDANERVTPFAEDGSSGVRPKEPVQFPELVRVWGN